jgi:catechol 2,3-dioxygenase-like lactoylglutathione lyase family enzyme
MTMTTIPPATPVRELWPLLFVRDIERSLAFYRDRLGFDVVGEAKAGGKAFWRRLQRGGASIMVQQAEAEDGPAEGRGRGVAFYFVCDDADVMHAELTARGLQLDPPSIAEYGMKQLFVPEPDGYAICFESALLEM